MMYRYSELITMSTLNWLVAMEYYDDIQKNDNLQSMENWHKCLETRMEMNNLIEELVENSKLYKEKNGL